MKHRFLSRSASLVSAALLIGLAACSEDQPSPIAPEAGLEPAASANAAIHIVILAEGVTDIAGASRGIGRANGFAPRFVWEHARGFSAVIPPGRLDAVGRDPRVLLVEPNGVVTVPRPIVRPAAPPWCGDNPNHPACAGDDDGGGGGQVVPWGIARVGGSGNGIGKTAWVIDTGVDLDHPDLDVDPSCSANFVTQGKNSPDDGNGHGTHVAGTIAAIDNDIDVVGVAAGARICAVRVLNNSGSGTYEWVINGVNFVAANAGSGDVANMSLGGPPSNSLDAAVRNAADGSPYFAIAAGNSGEHASNHSPARVEDAQVFTVSAIDDADCMPSWSNFGNPPVDYAAPGVSVLSLKRGGGTTTFSGTSMATPHVAGIRLLGSIGSDGTACNDPDGNPDPIAHR